VRYHILASLGVSGVGHVPIKRCSGRGTVSMASVDLRSVNWAEVDEFVKPTPSYEKLIEEIAEI